MERSTASKRSASRCCHLESGMKLRLRANTMTHPEIEARIAVNTGDTFPVAATIAEPKLDKTATQASVCAKPKFNAPQRLS